MTDPLFAYPHAGKASAIVGGVVYRGANLPALDGAVVFGDWGRGPQTLFAARPPVEGDGRWSVQQIRVQVPGPAGAQLLGVAEAEPSVLYLLTKDPGVGPEGNSGKIYSLASP